MSWPFALHHVCVCVCVCACPHLCKQQRDHHRDLIVSITLRMSPLITRTQTCSLSCRRADIRNSHFPPPSTCNSYDYVLNICDNLNYDDDTCVTGSSVCQRHKHTQISTDVYGFVSSMKLTWDDPDANATNSCVPLLLLLPLPHTMIDGVQPILLISLIIHRLATFSSSDVALVCTHALQRLGTRSTRRW